MLGTLLSTLKSLSYLALDFPGGTSGRESTCQCRRRKKCGFDPWVGEIPWSRKWEATLAFLPGKIPWTEEPSSLQFTGSQGVRHDRTFHSILFIWRLEQLCEAGIIIPILKSRQWLRKVKQLAQGCTTRKRQSQDSDLSMSSSSLSFVLSATLPFSHLSLLDILYPLSGPISFTQWKSPCLMNPFPLFSNIFRSSL